MWPQHFFLFFFFLYALFGKEKESERLGKMEFLENENSSIIWLIKENVSKFRSRNEKKIILIRQCDPIN